MGDTLKYAVGQAETLSRTVTAAEIERFADASGDDNPMHLDEAFAATTRFGQRIAHGMLGASYISALIGTRFPDPGAIYVSQTLQFRAPVFIDDVLTVTAAVTHYRAGKGLLTLETTVANQHSQVVIRGEAVCLIADMPEPAYAGAGTPAPATHSIDGRSTYV